MTSISIRALSLFAVIIFGQADASLVIPNTTNTSEPTASSYTPPEFIRNFNHSFCPTNTKAINVPPVVTYYPHSTYEIWAIIGNFYHITWINPAIKTQGEGPDNKVGAIRHQQGDPFAKSEILTAYYAGDAPGNQGFFGQMSNYAQDTVDVAPGWTIAHIRPVLTMVPCLR